MADIDIDPFEEHNRTESRTDETGENIPLTPLGGSTWEPEREQEMSFRGESHRTKLVKDYDRHLYQKLSESRGETLEHFTMIISKSKMGNCTTEARESP